MTDDALILTYCSFDHTTLPHFTATYHAWRGRLRLVRKREQRTAILGGYVSNLSRSLQSIETGGGTQCSGAKFKGGGESQRSDERGAAVVVVTWAGSSPSAAVFGTSVRSEVGRWNVQLPEFSTARLFVHALSLVLFAQLLVLARSGGVLVGQSVLAGTPILASGSVPRRPAPGLALASCPPRRSVSGSALTVVSTARTAFVFFLELYRA